MQTARLRLRPPERDDLAFLRDLSNDPVVRSNVVGWDWPLSLAGQESWFSGTVSSHDVRRFIIETLDGEPLGLTGLWEIDWRNGTAMSSIKLGGSPEARGRGVGEEALRAMIDFAFVDAGLRRLHTTILASNAASLALYVRKLGWTEEGRLRAHVRRDGGFVDLVQLGLLRDEWRSAAAGPGAADS